MTACGSGTDSNTVSSNAGADLSKIYKWKMVTTWPANFPVFQEGAEKFADDVRVMSNGRLNIRVYAGGEIVPALQVFDAVSQGTVQMGHSGAYYWKGKIPASPIFSSIPFAIAGAVLGLYVTGLSFSMMAFIGLISLFGIVVNNAIILIDTVNRNLMLRKLKHIGIKGSFIGSKPI